MKKKLTLTVLSVATVGIIGGVSYGLSRPTTPAPVKSYQATTTTTATDTQPIDTTTTQPATTTQPEPTVTTQPTATPAPTTADLQAEAKTRIVADTGNEEQYNCFNQIMDYWYGWNVTESKMLAKIDTVEKTYVSFCSAWGNVQHFRPGTGRAPTGFED